MADVAHKRQARGKFKPLPPPPPDAIFLRLLAASAIFSIPLGTLKMYAAEGRFPTYHVGRHLLVKRTELQAFIEAQLSPASVAARELGEVPR